MNAALQKDCMTECFHDVELMIYKVIDAFIKNYSLYDRKNLNDFKGIAFLAFCEAVPEYDASKAKFSTFIYHRVYNALRDSWRKDLRWHRVREDDTLEKKHERFDGLFSLLCDLDDDASSIYNLIIDAPQDLMSLISAEGGDNRKVQQCLTKYLKDNGWTRQQIACSYKQITRALYS